MRRQLWTAKQDPFYVPSVPKGAKDSWEDWTHPVIDGVLLEPDSEYPFTRWVNRDIGSLEPVREGK